MDGVTIEADAYSLDLADHEVDEVWAVFNDADLDRHFSEHVLVVARDEDGDIIGAVTAIGDELSLAVIPDRQREGIGTAMIKKLLEVGGNGFMVAGTEAGASFLFSLPNSLGGFPEALDVPLWESMRNETDL